MSLQEYRINSYAASIKDLPDRPSEEGMTAEELKDFFDSRSDNEIKNSVNGIIDTLNSGEGAAQIGTAGGITVAGELHKLSQRIDEANAETADVDWDLDMHKADAANPHLVTKAQVGLGNADNTADLNKPLSLAAQAALTVKANLNSPAFTGTPTAPTPPASANDTQIATTAFVNQKAGVPEAPVDGGQYGRRNGEWSLISGGGGGAGDHSTLANRDVANQHPTSAITGLDAMLAGKASLVASAVNNNFAALDANGNLKDSNRRPSDFASVSAVNRKAETITVYSVIDVNTWSDITAPAVNYVSADGVILDDNPIIDVVLDDDIELAIVQEEEWGKITRIVVSDNDAIIAYSHKAIPTVSLPVQIKVVR